MPGKQCWEIMNCRDSRKCPARMNPVKMCWEYAQDFELIQSAYGICFDCIVYMAKKNSPVVSAEQLENILRARQSFSHLYNKCPLRGLSDPTILRLEKREAKRFAYRGESKAFLSSTAYKKHPCQLLELSATGLSFASDLNGYLSNAAISLDLVMPGVTLHKLPMQIISDVVISEQEQELRRYGGKFVGLSDDQEELIVNFIQNQADSLIPLGVRSIH